MQPRGTFPPPCERSPRGETAQGRQPSSPEPLMASWRSLQRYQRQQGQRGSPTRESGTGVLPNARRTSFKLPDAAVPPIPGNHSPSSTPHGATASRGKSPSRAKPKCPSTSRTACGPRPSKRPTSRKWTPPTQLTPRHRNFSDTVTVNSPTSGSIWNSTAGEASRRARPPFPSPS